MQQHGLSRRSAAYAARVDDAGNATEALFSIDPLASYACFVQLALVAHGSVNIGSIARPARAAVTPPRATSYNALLFLSWSFWLT